MVTKWDHTVRGWVFAALLAGCMAAQVLPFYFSYDPQLGDAGLPAHLAERFTQAAQYERPREWGGFCTRFAAMSFVALVLNAGIAPWVDRRYGSTPVRWMARLLFFVAAGVGISLVGVPFAFRSYLSRYHFGLTHLSAGDWARHFVIYSTVPVLTFALRHLLVYAVMGIFRRWWWIAAATTAFLVFQVVPEWISPARPIDPVNHLEPLPEGELRQALTRVSAAAGYDLAYYVVDQSRRRAEVNMYVTGRVGREYVVVTDTLPPLLSTREAAIVLAHELFHQENRGRRVLVVKTLAALEVLLVYYLGSLMAGRRSVARPRRLQIIAWLWLIAMAVDLAMMPLTSASSRHEERRADRYALEVTDDPEEFARTVLRVSEINLTPYDMPRWVYHLGATHPTTRERVAFAETWARR